MTIASIGLRSQNQELASSSENHGLISMPPDALTNAFDLGSPTLNGQSFKDTPKEDWDWTEQTPSEMDNLKRLGRIDATFVGIVPSTSLPSPDPPHKNGARHPATHVKRSEETVTNRPLPFGLENTDQNVNVRTDSCLEVFEEEDDPDFEEAVLEIPNITAMERAVKLFEQV
ncbi:hypothetical protein VTK73DRAFT_4716 [Phialemonium thermophilum]|uniref:Uncharacterized protein n=1 Tax=Phialemonium thermophilum TaxID=223376 RepID=A0ABR3WSI8_9PEZI